MTYKPFNLSSLGYKVKFRKTNHLNCVLVKTLPLIRKKSFDFLQINSFLVMIRLLLFSISNTITIS